MNFEKLGLKCGIEVHQQLNTRKLFCDCPCITENNKELPNKVVRRLRFSIGETGDIDKAAEAEFKKGKYNVYLYDDSSSCLVELDEEPPHEVNKRALEVALKVAYMLNCFIPNKIQFMRKIIIDGSNTSGFQRTALVGLDGFIEIGSKRVSITSINLEEDSARIIEVSDSYNVFALDRLGIPLIEIGTGPEISSPEEAYLIARYIGNVLRSFRELKRGIGSIRQDINVSIRDGARVELKGVQKLENIPDIIRNEVRRQLNHIKIIDRVKKLGLNNSNFSDFKVYDLTSLFVDTSSNLIKKTLLNKGKVYGIKLYKCLGILGEELQEDYRFATELKDRTAIRFPQIKGILHGDELPAYGISEEEVNKIRKKMNLGGTDNFLLIAHEENLAYSAMKYLLEILSELLFSVPSEVRKLEGIKSRFLRPMPGAARMYPETDVPIIDVEKLKKICKKSLPEFFPEKISRLKNKWGLDESEINKILERFQEEEFDVLTNYLSPRQLYHIIFSLSKEVDAEPLSFDEYKVLSKLLKQGDIDKNFIIKVYKEKGDKDIRTFLKENVKEHSDEEVVEVIKNFLKEAPTAPDGVIIGKVIKFFKGEVSGKRISELLKFERNKNGAKKNL